ncbi:MAG TPA: Fic/DOC family N-terminal domain-containing protein, partial [Candidatus Acidoferrum sp.]|nr:Fic/DOC family N-terminal domain-containing protein [Candidatus Acidoferrum sp.]
MQQSRSVISSLPTLLSSQIEGTQSSLSDLLLFENDAELSVPMDDVEEVSNYVAAMQHGLRRIAGGFPLSLSDSYAKFTPSCCAGGRGANRTPGEFRRSQNWVGGTRPGNATVAASIVIRASNISGAPSRR